MKRKKQSTDKQLGLPILEPVPHWKSLTRDEEQLLCYILVQPDGGLIPLPVHAEAIRGLRAKGLIRDVLVAPGYIEVTELGERVMEAYFNHLRQSGQMW